MMLRYKVIKAFNFIIDNAQKNHNDIFNLVKINNILEWVAEILTPKKTGYNVYTNEKLAKLSGTALYNGKISIYQEEGNKKNYCINEQEVLKGQKVVNTIDLQKYSNEIYNDTGDKFYSFCIEYKYCKRDGLEHVEKCELNVYLEYI